MPRLFARALAGLLTASAVQAQSPLTWDQIRERFRANNANLAAGRGAIAESRAQEITAYLRPNPVVTTAIDQLTPFAAGAYQPLTYIATTVSAGYLHERQHKRELRRESAQGATAITSSIAEDQDRNLLFNLRTAFVSALRAKAILALAQENLIYYDRVLEVNRDRQQAGDISQVDLGRLELQRIQYESDVQTAQVNVRTAKIQLLTLMNDRTPVEQFDVNGTFDFREQIPSLEELRREALNSRPDLKAAMQTVAKAMTDHQLAIANGSADPVFGLDLGRNIHTGPPAGPYLGGSVTIPLRIFDRNQGEKLRTELDIVRNQKLVDADTAQVFGDVDSAYAALSGSLALLRPYKDKYLQQAASVRDTISFAYQNGGASLLEFLNAQSDFRNLQVSYLNLVGTYLTAVGQVNLAVGREVFP
jgi:cobalt-zinc-cadmium efflux system outer membrane protein